MPSFDIRNPERNSPHYADQLEEKAKAKAEEDADGYISDDDALSDTSYSYDD